MSLCARLAELAPALSLGATTLLGLGCLLSLSRALRLRQHAAEAAVVATLLFVGVALLPLPRPIAAPGRVAGAVAAPLLARPPDRSVAPVVSTSDRVAALAARPVAVGPSVASGLRPLVRQTGDRARAATSEQETSEPRMSSPVVAATWWAAAYLLASAAMHLWLLAGGVRLWRVVRAARPAPPPLAAWLASRTDARRRPRLLVSPTATRPFCVGLVRPAIVLPAHIVPAGTAFGPVTTALLHELAHIRRGHHWRALVLALALPFLFVHPLFWWLRRRARRAAEMVADADAAAACGDRRGYARQLLDLAEVSGRLRVPAATAGAVFVFRRPSELSERIEMLISNRGASLSPHRVRRGFHLAGLAVATALCVGLWGATPVPAQTRDDVALRELRRERDLLREELQNLRREVEAMRATKGEPVEAGGRSPRRGDVVEVTVNSGDSLASIARRVTGDASPEVVERILALNPDLEPRRLRVGQRLVVPASDAPAGLPRRVDGQTTTPGSPRPASDHDPAASDVGAALQLMTRQIELEGEVAKARVQARHAEAEPQAVREVAQITLHTAERKLELVRQTVEFERQALRAELDAQAAHLGVAAKLQEGGFLSAADLHRQEAALMRLRARLEMLSAGSAQEHAGADRAK